MYFLLHLETKVSFVISIIKDLSRLNCTYFHNDFQLAAKKTIRIGWRRHWSFEEKKYKEHNVNQLLLSTWLKNQKVEFQDKENKFEKACCIDT